MQLSTCTAATALYIVLCKLCISCRSIDLTTWQDGKPYIQQATAHQPYDDPRSQGYTLVARTVFNSKADMDFYDNECEAHTAIKSLIKPKVGGPPLVIYMDA